MFLRNCAAFKALLRENSKINLILLNIDNFSNINDSFGIEFGDEIFRLVEDDLDKLNFSQIDVYKLESDEFALVSKTMFDLQRSIEIANEVASFFNETEFKLDEDLSVSISFSVGIAMGKGLNVLNQARLATDELREHTRGTYKVYDMKSSYIRAIQDNVYWVNRIQESVAEDNIVAFYQPIINNKTNKIEKYECLARIEDDGELISPYHFMDAAKKTRLTSFITKSVIKQSCKTFAKNTYQFSINVTNDDLQLNYLEDYLIRNLAIHNIDPSRVVLELLEDIPSLEKGSTISQLKSLQALGFEISIDDFGSESSNFSRLLEFDPNYIKIDGAFIKNIMMDNKSQIITEGIVKIAHGMNMKVIAEYIHDADTQEAVVSLGVDYSQGFYHGEPSRTLKEETN